MCSIHIRSRHTLPCLLYTSAFEAAPDPKIVVSYGACGCTGGIFYDNYCVWGGTDKILPVDVYIPGCPPSPAQTVYGFACLLYTSRCV